MTTDVDASKVCGECRQDLPRTAFYKCSRLSDGLQAWCKDCQRVTRAKNLLAQRQASPEFRAELAKWQREERRRLRQAIYEFLGTSCWTCGTDENLDIDHVNNDGVTHRTEKGKSTTYYASILEDLQAGRNRYSLLCKSCHGRATRERHFD